MLHTNRLTVFQCRTVFLAKQWSAGPAITIPQLEEGTRGNGLTLLDTFKQLTQAGTSHLSMVHCASGKTLAICDIWNFESGHTAAGSSVHSECRAEHTVPV